MRPAAAASASRSDSLSTGEAADAFEQSWLELLSDHRCDRQQSLRIRREHREPFANGSARAFGQLEAAKIQPLRASQLPFGYQHPHHAIDEQRIARSCAMQVGDETRAWCERGASLDHPRHFGLGQARQRDLIALAQKFGNRFGEHLRTAHFDIAVIADDHDVRVAQSACDKLEHLQRVLIGFVQIVKNENQGLRASGVLEHRGDAVEEPKARLIRIRRSSACSFQMIVRGLAGQSPA